MYIQTQPYRLLYLGSHDSECSQIDLWYDVSVSWNQLARLASPGGPGIGETANRGAHNIGGPPNGIKKIQGAIFRWDVVRSCHQRVAMTLVEFCHQLGGS